MQHVMMDTASTLFEISCSENACQGGGHDLTHTVFPRLRHRPTEVSGSSEYTGAIGCGQACNRHLEYSFEAKYSRVA